MTVTHLLEKVKHDRIGDEPVVIFPLRFWKGIEDKLEDLQMVESKDLKKKIAKARSEKTLYSAAKVKKLLGL